MREGKKARWLCEVNGKKEGKEIECREEIIVQTHGVEIVNLGWKEGEIWK